MDDPTQPLIDALCDELGVTDVELVDSVRNAIELAFRQGQTGHDRNLILAGLAYAVTEMVARHDSRAEPLTDAETQAVHDGVAAAFDLGVEAGRPSTGDPLIDAEIQMVDHQVDLFRQLMERAMKRIPATEELDEDAMREAVADLVMEDDEARDLLGRLGVLERFSRPQAEGGS